MKVTKRKPMSEETKRKISIAHKGKSMSGEAKKNMSIAKKGLSPWNKGKSYSIGHRNGGYQAIHKWLEKYYGKANRCENPDCKGISRRFHWAKIQGFEYEHKRENFMMLCVQCHRNYDLTDEMRKVLKHSKDKYKKVIGQFDKNGVLIKEWLGFDNLITQTGFNKGNINTCILGYKYRKTAHGFIWRYL